MTIIMKMFNRVATMLIRALLNDNIVADLNDLSK